MLTLATLLFSCQEPELSLGPQNVDDRKYLLTEERDPRLDRRAASYSYDEFDRLIRQSFWEDQVYRYEFKYSSPEAKHPDYFEGTINNLNYTTYLTYDEDLLVESRSVTRGLEELLFLEKYDYDDDGHMIKRTVYPGIIGAYLEIEYEWDMGNVVKERAQYDGFSATTETDYDTRTYRRNPYLKVYKDIGYNHHRSSPLSQSNWLTRITRNTSNPDEVETGKNLYSYNIGGYPYYGANENKDRYGEVSDIRRNLYYIF